MNRKFSLSFRVNMCKIFVFVIPGIERIKFSSHLLILLKTNNKKGMELRHKNSEILPPRENCDIPSDPIFSTITASCRQRKSRSNYLAALEESFLAEGERRREKGRRYPFELARGRAAW